MLLVFALQISSIGGLLLFVERSSVAAQESDERADTEELRDGLLDSYRAGGERLLVKSINARLAEVRSEAEVILLERADGSEVAGNLSDWPANVAPSASWQEIDLYRKGSTTPAAVGLMATAMPGGLQLLTGHVVEGSAATRLAYREALVDALLIAVPLSLLIAAVAELIISRRIAKVARTVRGVRDGNLSQRVASGRSADAFDRLGNEVNAMLDQIEDLVRELRNLTDGLAHDLRSPLTRLRLKLEQAQSIATTDRGMQILSTISQEADMLLAMLGTALEISRAEAGIGRQQREVVDAAALVRDLCELHEPIADENGYTLECQAPGQLLLLIQREQVARAISNLIDNATLYAAGGDKIRVRLVKRPGGADFIVEDNGQGIPEQRRDEALRRFGRLDPARHVPGSGLGLTLADAVARLHDGRVRLENAEPGLRVVLEVRMQGTGTEALG